MISDLKCKEINICQISLTKNMWNKYIFICTLFICILLGAVIYVISLNNLQLAPIISLISVLTGVLITSTINLILEDNRLEINRGKLISSIRAKNSMNSSTAQIIISVLEEEIASINKEKIAEINDISSLSENNFFLILPLYDLEPLNELMEDVKLLMEEESKLLPRIASEIQFINKDIIIRQEMILKGVSLKVILNRDLYLIKSLKDLRKNLKKYEKDAFGKELEEVSIDELELIK